MGTGDVPGAPSSGIPRKSQSKVRDRTVWGLYKGPVGNGSARSVFGEIRFVEKPGVQDEGVRHVAKRSSDTRVVNPEVKVQVRDLVRVVGIVAFFDPRGSVPVKNSFYRVPGGTWAQETCAVSSAAVCHGRAR